MAKLPLGFLVPRFRKELPDDFPYNPYWRDAIVVSLAMMCRGEFNFIIASFSLAVGLLTPELYAAVVLANLIASIVSPLLLAKAIRYYNGLSEQYMSTSHPVKRLGSTCNGYRPLFLAIQARTPVHWGLQDSFHAALEADGLVVIDHRYWHTLGLDAMEITELFVQDTKVKVTVTGCFSKMRSSTRGREPPAGEEPSGSMVEALTERSTGSILDGMTEISGSKGDEAEGSIATESDDEDALIRARCEEMKAGTCSLIKGGIMLRLHISSYVFLSV
jgi:hypothetical protein